MEDPVVAGLQEAVLNSPDNVPLRSSLARLLLDSHRYKDAEILLRDGLERSPQNETFQTGLSEAFYGLGRFSEALAVLDELLKGSQPSPGAMLIAARCYFQREDPREAGRLYRRALDLDPNPDQPVHRAPVGEGTEEPRCRATGGGYGVVACSSFTRNRGK